MDGWMDFLIGTCFHRGWYSSVMLLETRPSPEFHKNYNPWKKRKYVLQFSNKFFLKEICHLPRSSGFQVRFIPSVASVPSPRSPKSTGGSPWKMASYFVQTYITKKKTSPKDHHNTSVYCQRFYSPQAFAICQTSSKHWEYNSRLFWQMPSWRACRMEKLARLNNTVFTLLAIFENFILF